MSESDPTKPILLQGLDDVEDQDMEMQEAAAAASTPTAANAAGGSVPTPLTSSSGGTRDSGTTLISQIVTPSPFQHHNDSATNDRYRSALQRVTASPSSDVEAWEAIMNECMSLYRTQLLPEISEERNTHKMMLNAAPPNARVNIQRNEILEKKLDWVESCHGHLLKYFPYACNYFITTVEMLMARSALPFESLTGGDDDFSFGGVNNWLAIESQNAAAKKIDRIFELALGVKPDGSPAGGTADTVDEGLDGNAGGGGAGDEDENEDGPTAMQVLGGMCTSSVELWLLYIRKRSRDAKRQALQSHSIPSVDPSNPMKPIIKVTATGEELIREWIVGAYETALSNGASFVFNNHLVWKQYLTYVKSWNIMSAATSTNPGQEPMIEINHALQAKQKELLRAIYQRLIALPMLGLDALWVEYETFEKAQSEQLASALIAENLPKYQHARSVYLERNRVYSFHSLKYGRLATPPADFEFVNATDGSKKEDIDEQAYKTKLQDECELLSKWKRRCGYERTNPERLSAADLTIRVRQCYKDSICCFMRHIEIWHEWSSWELLNTGGSGASSSSNAAGVNAKKRHINLAIGVLELAQKHVPDSTLLAYGHAQILESQASTSTGGRGINGARAPSDQAIQVMNDFCERAGNTLGYILLQRLVRKYKGVKEARAVFSDARRKLRVRPEDCLRNGKSSTGEAKVAGGESGEGKDDSTGKATAKIEENAGTRKMVMDRNNFNGSGANVSEANANKEISSTGGVQAQQKRTGYITWQLYAAHAEVEHRLNASPKVASRVFELGLRKHRSFLSTPQYVLQYSALLLELGEEENLRALLIRSISACEEEIGTEGDDTTTNVSSIKTSAAKREALRPLWDLMLRFETTLLSQSSGDLSAVQSIEARRRKSLYGPMHENFTGSKMMSGGDDGEVGIGMQKSSLSETLIRVDGYDISSRIANGLDRMVDSLEVSGILGQESMANMLSLLSSISPGDIWKDDGAGGQSDASFRRRRQFKLEMNSLAGLVTAGSTNTGTGGVSSSAFSSGRLLSAKERLAQSAAQSQSNTVHAAVQSSPEWLRGMLMLLPATLRNYRGAKAPPHLIELALAALRDNPLPAVRPAFLNDGTSSTQIGNGGGFNKRQRKDMNGGDGNSSDEENFGNSAGGYGSQFRSRQRSRMLGTAGSGATS